MLQEGQTINNYGSVLGQILQPEKTVLDRFEEIITPIFDGVYQMMQENKNLIQQRDLLLPRLMSGKIQV